MLFSGGSRGVVLSVFWAPELHKWPGTSCNSGFSVYNLTCAPHVFSSMLFRICFGGALGPECGGLGVLFRISRGVVSHFAAACFVFAFVRARDASRFGSWAKDLRRDSAQILCLVANAICSIRQLRESDWIPPRGGAQEPPSPTPFVLFSPPLPPSPPG